MKKTMLSDIAGYESEKAEAKKIIEFLKHYEEYTSEGVDLTKGVLFSGEPGVGKTLLARAIANESGVPFIEFKNDKENVVDNISKTFAKAREKKPCILFVDELDSLVTNGAWSDTSKAIERTFLSEIDGIMDSSGVMVIAACNNKKCVSRALLRSGRLERQISIDLPNYKDRIAILDYYLGKHEELKEISREAIARKINGFSGADIASLVNEVLLDCKANGRAATLKDFESYIPAVKAKDIKKENDTEIIESVASHEIGHFIANYALCGDVASICIDRYGTTLGVTSAESKEANHRLLSTLKRDLIILLGGFAGEKVIRGDVVIGGCSSDIQRAYDLAWRALNSGVFGFEYCCEVHDTKRAYGTINESEGRLERTERKAAELLDEALESASKIIEENLGLAKTIMKALLKEHLLSSEKLTEIVARYNKAQAQA